jgi:hypothetical protein
MNSSSPDCPSMTISSSAGKLRVEAMERIAVCSL